MSKVLVAYFTASGGNVTGKVAERLAEAVGGDLFEIVPETLYTAEDLDWRNKESRSTIEMQDRNSRPPIASKVEDMAQYDTVFVGFPVWWYREPSIIDTFIEQYDFTGKTVVPFATSGGSKIGETGKNLKELAPDAKVEEGLRFAADVTVEELKDWAKAWC